MFLRLLKTPLVFQILFCMAIGVVLGLSYGENVSGLGIIGKIFIQLIKGIAIPLVFFAIIEAILSTSISVVHARRLFVVIGINATIAASIGIFLSNTIQPGTRLDLASLSNSSTAGTLSHTVGQKLEISALLSGYLPDNFIKPFYENNLIAVVILALLVGIAASNVRSHPDITSEDKNTFERLVRYLFKICEQILHWLVRLVPLAVLGVTAKTVGEHGFEPISGLIVYVAVGIFGLLLHASIVYPLWITFVGKIKLSSFFHAAKKPLIYAFGTNSSLATLPLTLHALDELKVPKAASRLGACIGTNLNNDGILLYEAMAVLFVAQAHGIDLTIAQQLLTAALCVIAAIGVAGIPEAGIVSLSLVLTTVGLPLEILPLLLTVDWIVARMRSVINVFSDLTVSIAIGGLMREK